MNDTERLDWLASQFGVALIHDDNGHWSVSFNGMQNVPSGEAPADISMMFFIEDAKWRESIREAIDAAIAEESQ